MWHDLPPLQELGALKGLIRPAHKETRQTVVLFHGYGANAYDLFSIADFMDAQGKYRWVFPDGHQSAQGVPMGRQWFPIDIAALEKALQSGDFRSLADTDPPELAQARQKTETMLSFLNAEPESTILGGFSQGSMLAVDLLLDSQKKWAGLLAFSSTLLAQKRWRRLSESHPGFSFVQSHGKADPLLSFTKAEELYELLGIKGFGEFISFSGGHEIPPVVLKKANEWLHSAFRS